MLHQGDRLPDGFLHAGAGDLHRLLPGPSLIHLPGAPGGTLFVTLLQHGNEDSGLRAVQRLLAEFRGHELPRPLSLFIANVAAAREGLRRLDDQPDFNRCWPGTDRPPSPETEMMSAVVAEIAGRSPFAAVDLHNTTGHNPVHAAVNCLEPGSLGLAQRFAGTVVHFTRPLGAMPGAFGGVCPAVILECGRIGLAEGIDRAHAFLRQCLLSREPAPPAPAAADLDLFSSAALVTIPGNVRFRFGEPVDADLGLDPQLDRWNFIELAAETVIARVRGGGRAGRYLLATGPDGADLTESLFEVDGDALRLRRPLMPSLLTRDPRVIRQDCLCHLMARIDPPGLAPA